MALSASSSCNAPWEGSDSADIDRIVLLMPVLAALTYALNQVFTRKLT
ncbi:hypothetical protein [Parasedimentitalea psychrophila]|uniref:Uncharacterized protein n=1 Tax=Parasedimentitalea psychrophila TaxID=2997337 RepID=A0A9Y2L1A6_9RHOB|nr:hypothetical protein [Parasedimentitalea psychrophila]WIY26125.1 hypothetical protein QPJ95_04135 [Parasedimentitalea psychrophila]